MWRWILLVFTLLLVGCSSGIVQELEEEPQAQVTDDDPPVDTVQTGSMPTLTSLQVQSCLFIKEPDCIKPSLQKA